MKKKSGSRRRTKIVHRSKKNLRRTIKRKSLGKGKRRTTRQHSRIQRGGGNKELEKKILEQKKKAEDGDVKAMKILFNHYFYEGDINDALEYLEKAVKAGDKDSQYRLGAMYAMDNLVVGQAVEQDYTKAAQLFRLAADQGHADAQYNLGNMYADGQGVAQDDTEAAQLYRAAAEKGHAGAQVKLGVMLVSDRGVEKNIDTALEYFNAGKKVFVTSNDEFEKELNDMYKFMKDVKDLSDNKNAINILRELGNMFKRSNQYNKAAPWYHLAASHGDADAQFELGQIYNYSRGVHQDYAEAERLYTLAAEQGHAEAAYNLGIMYYEGKGILKDEKKAMQFFNLASEKGYQAATRKLSQITKGKTQ
jgi:TPR repeat protein